MSTEALVVPGRRHQQRPAQRGRRKRSAFYRAEVRGAYALVSPYLLLLLVAGVIPVAYALIIAFQKPVTPLNPDGGFGGFQAFTDVITDYRFISSFGNIFGVLLIWLPIMMIGIVGLALLIHA